jgi:hypothetical protein
MRTNKLLLTGIAALFLATGTAMRLTLSGQTMLPISNRNATMIIRHIATGIAALFLATGTAYASGHSTFFECGQHRVMNIYVSPDDFEFWQRVSNYDDNNPKRIPLRMIKRKGGTVQVIGTDGSGQPIKAFIPNYYYRGQKCEEITRAKAIDGWQ